MYFGFSISMWVPLVCCVYISDLIPLYFLFNFSFSCQQKNNIFVTFEQSKSKKKRPNWMRIKKQRKATREKKDLCIKHIQLKSFMQIHGFVTMNHENIARASNNTYMLMYINRSKFDMLYVKKHAWKANKQMCWTKYKIRGKIIKKRMSPILLLSFGSF